ncbi:UNVERIFIED_CONTAM: hypothetical protein GTU68_049162 [Idotea baltica]|nr:hypothetical protein [Idotea baltica]
MPGFAGITDVYKTDLGAHMVGPQSEGERITVQGRIFDGAEDLVTDAMVEIWQADHQGNFASGLEARGQSFSGWGRQPTDAQTGIFKFETIKPGRVAWSDGRLQAPFISVWIVARGINLGLHTRMYFADEDAANAQDPVLQMLTNPARRSTLIAARRKDTYLFDINLQGENETIFFDI